LTFFDDNKSDMPIIYFCMMLGLLGLLNWVLELVFAGSHGLGWRLKLLECFGIKTRVMGGARERDYVFFYFFWLIDKYLLSA
jgi:hypothetical protein